MLDELDLLIAFIQKKYKEINIEWKNSELYLPLNMKTNTVKDIYNNENILNTIFNYRTFLNNKNLELSLAFKSLQLESVVNIRVKAQNSIEYKVNNYVKNHNEGKTPINKCFNDIFGIRIILKDEITFNDIKQFLNSKYGNSNLKCIDSSKGEYVATHIYFRDGNLNFQWELQVWSKSKENTNKISHEKYKQGYTIWENENKEGKHYGITLYNNEQ